MSDVRGAGVVLVDATRGLEAEFAVKDEEGRLQVTRAGHLTSRIARNVFVAEMESIIDEEREVDNAGVAAHVEAAFEKLDEYKIKVDTENFDVMVKPVVQSGGVYNVHVMKGDVTR